MTRTGKLHPQYRIVGFDGTSRVYSTEPSLSQLPSCMRDAMIPPEGKKFLYLDLKAAECYILIKWAQCAKLVDAYESGGDLYTVIAKEILGKDEVTKEERNKIKIVVLSILYGSEGAAAARALHCSEEETRAIVQKFFRCFPEIAALQEKSYEFFKKHGYTATCCFRPRILKKPLSEEDERAVRRQSINTACQGGCADLMKKCIGEIPLDGPVEFVTSVFDSALFEVPIDWTQEDGEKFVQDFLVPAHPFKFRAEFAFGSSWGEAYKQL